MDSYDFPNYSNLSEDQKVLWWFDEYLRYDLIFYYYREKKAILIERHSLYSLKYDWADNFSYYLWEKMRLYEANIPYFNVFNPSNITFTIPPVPKPETIVITFLTIDDDRVSLIDRLISRLRSSDFDDLSLAEELNKWENNINAITQHLLFIKVGDKEVNVTIPACIPYSVVINGDNKDLIESEINIQDDTILYKNIINWTLPNSPEVREIEQEYSSWSGFTQGSTDYQPNELIAEHIDSAYNVFNYLGQPPTYDDDSTPDSISIVVKQVTFEEESAIYLVYAKQPDDLYTINGKRVFPEVTYTDKTWGAFSYFSLLDFIFGEIQSSQTSHNTLSHSVSITDTIKGDITVFDWKIDWTWSYAPPTFNYFIETISNTNYIVETNKLLNNLIDTDLYIMSLELKIQEIHACLGAGEFAYYEDDTGELQPYHMNMARLLQRFARAYGVSFKADGTILQIRQRKNIPFVDANATIPDGWARGQYVDNTQATTPPEGQPSTGVTADDEEERVGIAYQNRCNRYENFDDTDPTNNTYAQGDIVLCENFLQLYESYLEDLDKGLNWQEMGTGILSSPDGNGFCSYEGMGTLLAEAVYMLSQLSSNIYETHNLSLQNTAMNHEILKGLGLPLELGHLKVVVGETDPLGLGDSVNAYIPIPKIAEDSVTIHKRLMDIIINLSVLISAGLINKVEPTP